MSAAVSAKSKSSFNRSNDTFARGKQGNSNAMANSIALKRMTPEQALTGMTAEELKEHQAQLRADYYRRNSA